MSREDRKARAKQKRKAYQEQMLIAMLEAPDDSSRVTALVAKVNKLIKEKPQERTLIESTAIDLSKKIAEQREATQ